MKNTLFAPSKEENYMGTFIFDELTGMPTILATNRAKRVDQTGVINTIKPEVGDKRVVASNVCRFCKGNENLTPSVVYQDADDWNVRVFPNKYPLVDDHEIIVHSPQHDKDFEDLPHEQAVPIIRAFLNRVDYYNKQDKEVFIFNNRGGKAGASITHPHSQLVALKGFPGIIEHEKGKALKYYNEKSSCFWCDLVRSELAAKERIVHESEHFVLLVPKSCRWSYEMMLIPKEHKPNFLFINEREINDLTSILRNALISYDKLFDRPDRNFWIHTTRYEPYHWHMGFIPHIKVFGGLELGAGIWVSDKATPEGAANELRNHLVDYNARI